MKFFNIPDFLKIGVSAFIFIFFVNMLLKKYDPKFTTHPTPLA